MRRSIQRLTLAVAFIAVMMIAGMIGAQTEPAFAQDTDASLSVYQGDSVVKSYTMTELAAMADSQSYTYSAFNSYPSASLIEDVKGVRIATILADAGITSIGEDQLIEIVASDGVKESFLKKQLLGNRYYFPNFKNEAGRAGKAVLPGSLEGKQSVPAVLRINEPNSTRSRLYFGQVSPTEQNYSHFLKYVSAIRVNSGTGGQWNALQKTDPEAGKSYPLNTSISFDRGVNTAPGSFESRYCIYYTTDGSTPDLTSNLYNYNNKNFGTDEEKFNKPVISAEGALTIKTLVVGYGKSDSPVTTFRFTGVKEAATPTTAPAVTPTTAPAVTPTTSPKPAKIKKPATPKITSISCKGRTITLKWNRVKGASGYKIYRATKKNGKYRLIKTITKGKTVTYKNKKLKKKTRYYYKMRAYKIVSGKKYFSNYSAVKYKKTR